MDDKRRRFAPAGQSRHARAEGGLPLKRLFELAIPLVDAVHAAHSLDITHRDADFLPVVRGGDSRRLAGLLSRADIMEAYQTRLLLDE